MISQGMSPNSGSQNRLRRGDRSGGTNSLPNPSFGRQFQDIFPNDPRFGLWAAPWRSSRQRVGVYGINMDAAIANLRWELVGRQP